MFSPTSLSFVYTKDSLYALSKLQFSLTHAKFKFLYQLICCVSILIGALSPFPEALRILLLMLGCVALPCINFPVKMATDRVFSHYHGQLPTVSYRFNKYNFTRTVGANTDSIAYQDITQLVEESLYCYIVDGDNNVFVLPYKEVDNDRGIKQVKAYLTQETGYSWGRLKSIWSLSIYSLFKKRNP